LIGPAHRCAELAARPAAIDDDCIRRAHHGGVEADHQEARGDEPSFDQWPTLKE